MYGGDGQVIADSRVREGTGGAINTQPLPPPPDRGEWQGTIEAAYDWIMSVLPHETTQPIVQTVTPAAGVDWQPDVKAELRLTTSDQGQGAPYIRRTQDNRLLVTVVEPVQRNRHTVGIVSLTRDAREVDDSLTAIRSSILGLFVIALILTVMLSWYLSLTIARPILMLTEAAHDMREGHGRAGAVPPRLLRRSDEIGELATALHDSSEALWSRMDSIEQFAADVAHEIKNPLSSIRSAIETLGRIEDPAPRQRLLAIVTEDVMRLDRLISDISDASRVDAELSRAAPEAVNVVGILNLLAEINAATGAGEAALVVQAPDAPLLVQGVEDRLVQVLRNLIGNAQSFSPEGGIIVLRAVDAGSMVEIGIEDQGPGMPESRLEHVFDRFYSERPHGERFGQHSGLGLSISRQIVEALKGSIAAENRRDAAGVVIGARFVVRLPKA